MEIIYNFNPYPNAHLITRYDRNKPHYYTYSRNSISTKPNYFLSTM